MKETETRRSENHTVHSLHGGGLSVILNKQAITIIYSKSACVKNDTSDRGTMTELQNLHDDLSSPLMSTTKSSA